MTRRTERVDREGEGSHGHHRPDSRIVEELSHWDGEDDEERRDAHAERERPPKRCRPNPWRRTVGLNQSGAHPHVANSGRKRRERDRYRGGAVVGRLEEACENGDGDEAGALYADLTDELPQDPGAYRALYVKRAVGLGGGLGWGGVSHPKV